MHHELELTVTKCEAFNGKRRCPSFHFTDTSCHTDDLRLKPGLVLYRDDEIGEASGSQTPYLALPELFVEARKSRAWDPFIDPCPSANHKAHAFIADFESEKRSMMTSRTVGQMAAYAAEICARQHRTHCFSICIYGPTARFIRWDRSGAIVSRAFDYHENPKLLCQFLWMYSGASEAERGFDMTVGKASQEEETVFVQTVTKHIQDQLNPPENQLPELVEEHYEKGRVFKIAIRPQAPLPMKKKCAPVLEDEKEMGTVRASEILGVDSNQCLEDRKSVV